MARPAYSLDVLRDQIDAIAPARSKASDGWIGDPAHAARKSDHNPDLYGIVHARDITHDPDNGADMHHLFDALRVDRDPRISYVIHYGLWYSSYPRPGRDAWQVVPYTGTNAHLKHLHISVVADPALADDRTPWTIGDDLALLNDAQQARLARLLDGIDAANDTFPADDKTSEFGIGKTVTGVIRQHTRAAGTGYDHPATTGGAVDLAALVTHVKDAIVEDLND
jgi:hypothetical protein